MKNLIAWFVSERYLLLLLIVGLVTRLVIITFIPFRSDMQSWLGWGNQLVEYGIPNFYERTSWTDYTPGYFYILWLVSAVRLSFWPNLSSVGVETLYKLVPVIADLLSTTLIYLILKKSSSKSGASVLLATGVYLFAPFAMLTSAVWGQVESVSVTFALLAWYLISKDKLNWGIAAFTFACVVKPLIGLMSPGIILIYLMAPRQKLLSSMLVACGTFLLSTMPFWGIGAPITLINQLKSSYETYPATSINALNYWAIFGLWQNDEVTFAGLAQHSWASLLVGLSILAISLWAYLLARKSSDRLTKLNFGVALASMSSLIGYTFLSRMHERYLYQFFAIYLLAATLLVRKNLAGQIAFGLGMTLAILHSFNLYYVYVQYLYLPEAVPLGFEFFYFIYERISLWGIMQTVACVLTVMFLLWQMSTSIEQRKS